MKFPYCVHLPAFLAFLSVFVSDVTGIALLTNVNGLLCTLIGSSEKSSTRKTTEGTIVQMAVVC